jgi:iron complex transport system substrate-binding protein
MPAVRPSAVRPARLRRASRALAVAGLAGLLAACGTATAEDPGGPAASPAAAPTPTPTPTDDPFPLTVTNCGVEVTFDEPPQRVVAIKSSAIEMLLALGVGDRIVGTGFPDGPVPDEWADEAADLPQLAERVPSAEVVLGVEPDLVYAGWESALTAEGAGDRDTLAGLGVASYVSPSACREPEHQPDRLTFDLVFDEITEVATIMGVPEAAERLVAEQRALLADLEPDGRGLTALWYSSGSDIPYVGAGIGAPQMIMDAVGLTNIAAGVRDTWSSFSWEQVAADDPDVIVLVDSTWNSADRKRELLATSPATANLTAVREERYLVVPFPATEAGVRNVPAAVDLAAQLAALDL